LAGIVRRRASRTPTRCVGTHVFALEILKMDDPRCALAELLGWQGAVAKHAQDRGGTDGQSCGRLIERHLAAFGALTFSIGRNALAMSQRVNTAARPTVATAGRFPRTVQDRGDRLIWHMASEDSHKLDNVRIGHPAILTSFTFLHAQAGMIATLPMDDELDLVVHYVDHNLFN
jgi:hypothetical protein